MPRDVITISEPAVGRLRPSISPTQQDPAGYSRMDNCWAVPRSDGAIESVPGFYPVSTASQRLRALIYAKSEAGVKLLLAVGATKLFSISLADDSTFGDFTERATGLTYGQEVDWVVYGDAVYLFNGALPKKITIASTPVVSDPGVERPDVADWVSEGGVVVAIGAAGKVRGIVKYFISEVDTAVEGALSVEFGKTDLKSTPSKVTLTFDPTALTTPADMQNKDFRIYRTYADGEDPFLVGTVEVGTTSTVFTDNVDDDDLGDGRPISHGDPPPDGVLPAVMHLERAWGADGSDLYYSDVTQPESWFASANGQVISVFEDDGDNITALGSTRDGLLIWKQDHMYILTGKLEEEFVVDRITQSHQQSRNVGTPTVNSLAAVPSGFVFYWNHAVYTYINGRIKRISQEIESDFGGRFGANIDKYEDQVHLGYDSFNGRAWLSVPLIGSTSSHTYFYSFRLGYWVGRMEQGLKGYQYVDDANGDLRLWALGAS